MRPNDITIDPATLDRLRSEFWERVDKTPGLGPNGDCWEWRGHMRKCDGYGRVCVDRRSWLAHRLAFIVANGARTDGLHVCHSCDNRACCNPSHLWLGTDADNTRDMISKGRAPAPLRGESNATARFTAADVIAMREAVAGGVSQSEVARRYGTRQAVVCSIVRGTSWGHVGGPRTFIGRGAPGERSPHSKLTTADVLEARQLRGEGASILSIARRYGVSSATIRDAVNGRTWSHV